jgi:hypothetical protein
LLGACAANPYSTKSKGILVTNFFVDKPGTTLELIQKDKSGRPDAVIEMTPRDNFRVLRLPAGEYRWRQIQESGRIIPIEDMFEFTVLPNRTTYIGTMLIKSYRSGPKLSVINQSSEVKQRLLEEYPKLIQQYPYVIKLSKQH